VSVEGGWDLEVHRSGDTARQDNLLAPSRNWHGAQAFQVTVYMTSIYPNERVIPIRSASTSVCIRIMNARLEGDGFDRRYVDGVVEVRWSGSRGKLRHPGDADHSGAISLSSSRRP
jgi:hypothetical protein